MIANFSEALAPEPPAMTCEILMTTGAEAVVDVTVIGVEGERRVPTTEEFHMIIRCLAKHHFTLTLNEEA
jgi:hypothetical protein